ncbi:hypothetical protein ACR2RM_22410 [Pseudomonas aeruginosa]|uniref:hypothetical protein n=1 Tax=Pseudomonas aeruginosa TaxID=287 RepID=UPI003F2CC3A1
MTESKICTCPSGDGSLRWPCPKHPAVEQAGGDERAAFELFVRKHCGMPEHVAVNWDAKFTNDAWEGWQARAALAQPSPALPPFAEKVLAKMRRFYDCAEDFESGGVDIGRHWLDLLTQLGLLNRVRRSPAFWEISQQGEDLLGMPQPSPARTEQAEAERPEVVARVVHSNPIVLGQCGPLNANDELMTVAQHAASVALARVAELEMLLRKLSTNGLMQFSTVDEEMAVQAALGGAPVAQAQHSVPEGWMLVECGIWTQEQVDEMQKTVARFRNSEFVDDRALAMAVADAGQCKAPEISLAELLAAAPAQGGE